MARTPTAIMWLSGRVFKIIVNGPNGNTIDMNDEWNNRASAEMWCNEYYPDAIQNWVQNADKIRELEREWKYCKDGTG